MIWIEIETCKNIKDPLREVYKKMEKIARMNEEKPDDLWLVLPYRKLWTYGRKKIEESLRARLEDLFAKEIRVRLFLTNLYKEQLEELG